MGRSQVVDYGRFEDVAVERVVLGHPAGRRLTIAETAEVVRRMSKRGKSAQLIADRLGYHVRSVRRIRAGIRAREAAS